MKKKLLIFHPTIAPYRIDFFNSLFEAFDTRICLLYHNLKSQHFDYEKITGQFNFVPVYLSEITKIGRRVVYGGYWKQIKDFQPDIVIVGEFSLGVILVLLYKYLTLGKFKVVSICDDNYNMVVENHDFSKAHRLARKILVPMLDDIILVEPQIVEWYQEQYHKGFLFPIIKNEEKAREMYNRLMPLSQRTKAEIGLNGKKVFLFVGRLVNLKNVKTLIEAFAKIDQTKNTLVIIGEGPELKSLVEQASILKAQVIFTGRLEGDGLNQWYNIADCFILPSCLEPFGAVTNEALLAGCWCLVSNKAGSRCLIEENKNGYTFDPMNVDELAEKMNKSIVILSKEKSFPRKSRMLESYDGSMIKLIRHLKEI